MKKLTSKKHSNKTKMALFAGAALMASLATQARAQSADALIDKLVEKGILSANEAKDLRDQADNDFKTAFQAKMGMPDWVTGYKIYGDVRGRFEQFSSENAMNNDRTRLRYRIRFGVTASLMDNLEAGFRLGSGDAKGVGSQSAAGNPVSNNSTLQDNWTKKPVYIDTAYGKWTAINSGDWLLAATVGKMDNPFTFTPMVFDADMTPEGGALTGGYTINDKHSIAFAGAAFVLDEESTTTHDPFLYGGQVTWNAKWTSKWASSLGVGAFQVVSPEQLTAGANVPGVNQGNTRMANGAPAYNFNPIIADASVTYTLDKFPLYNGAFPIKVAAEYMNNPGAPSSANNGYWAGITFGKSGTKKTWDLSYRYEYLEADAWYDQLVDDDNGAFWGTVNYPSTANPGGGMSKGWVGGTNVKGHLIKFNYSLTDSLTFTATCFLNDLINLPQGPVGTDLNTGAMHFMADLMWKF
jgi:hypothetical protein